MQPRGHKVHHIAGGGLWPHPLGAGACCERRMLRSVCSVPIDGARRPSAAASTLPQTPWPSQAVQQRSAPERALHARWIAPCAIAWFLNFLTVSTSRHRQESSTLARLPRQLFSEAKGGAGAPGVEGRQGVGRQRRRGPGRAPHGWPHGLGLQQLGARRAAASRPCRAGGRARRLSCALAPGLSAWVCKLYCHTGITGLVICVAKQSTPQTTSCSPSLESR